MRDEPYKSDNQLQQETANTSTESEALIKNSDSAYQVAANKKGVL